LEWTPRSKYQSGAATVLLWLEDAQHPELFQANKAAARIFFGQRKSSESTSEQSLVLLDIIIVQHILI